MTETNSTKTVNSHSRSIKTSRFVSTPTVIQMEAAECGAAALDMVLAYYGRFVPLEQLRVECGVSRDGSKASNIIRVARSYGLIANGFRKETDELKELDFPVIVFWNFNHFVVVNGYDRDRWHLNDPAVGPRKVSAKDFDESYTGVCLTFELGPQFEPGGHKPSVVQALKSRAQGLGGPLLYAVAAGVGLAILGLVIPSFLRVFIDEYLVDGNQYWMRPLLWAMGLTLILQAVLTWLQQNVLLRLELKFAISTSSGFLSHVFRLPTQFFAQRFAGEVGSRVLLNDRVAELLSGQVATNALHLMMAAFFIAVMFTYDIALTLVGVGIAATNLLFLRYVSRKRKDLNKRMLQEQGKMLGFSMSGVQIIETVKAMGVEADFFAKWAGYQAKAVTSGLEMARYTQYLNIVPQFLIGVNIAVVLGLGALRVMQGWMTMGELVAFQALMTSFMTPVNNLVNLGGQLQDIEGDLQRLDDVLHHDLDPVLAESEQALQDPEAPVKLSGRLELRNVTFGYSRLEDPLIRDFSLTMQPGSRVAIVGRSGSGKSTIVKLVVGLYETWDGEILFDGKPLRMIPRLVMANSLAMVDQDILMFEGTIQDNLTLWDDLIPEEAVVRAARDACIHDAVSARPQGYESMVEEGGVNFSGGERQRLEIARALVGNPRIIILDEATSALDPLTEKLIDDNIRRRGCTCLIVAHRLSTIRDSDEIIVLDRGEVAQRGTHEELCAVDGPYLRLISEQS
jgi:NHLM bacteriocin system ABC transporter peptidase/ATP-binding protein